MREEGSDLIEWCVVELVVGDAPMEGGRGEIAPPELKEGGGTSWDVDCAI